MMLGMLALARRSGWVLRGTGIRLTAAVSRCRRRDDNLAVYIVGGPYATAPDLEPFLVLDCGGVLAVDGHCKAISPTRAAV